MMSSGRGVTGPGGSVRSASSGTPSQDGILPLQTIGDDGDAWLQVTPAGKLGCACAGASPINAANGAIARNASRRRIL
jgi:hypothetical protein